MGEDSMNTNLERRRSEDVIINGPMSFAGAFQRSMRIRRAGFGHDAAWYVKLPLTAVAVFVLVFWEAFVVVWYLVVFGLLFVIAIPYRILRRGARKRKMEMRRHRELMGAVESRKEPPL